MEFKKGLTEEQIKELQNQNQAVIKAIGMYQIQLLHYKEMIKNEYAKFLTRFRVELHGGKDVDEKNATGKDLGHHR